MDEFLDKLQEDQRRMRKYLSAKGLRFRAMGEALAACGNAGGRVFVAGEPPLDMLTRVIGREYFPHLSIVLIDDPEETAVELTGDDVLLAFLHEGKHKRVRRLLERARARHSTVLIVGGLGARTPSTKRQAEVLITLPTRGIKTVVESCFICARILARVSRAALTEEAEPAGSRGKSESRSKSNSRTKSSPSKSEGAQSEDTKSRSKSRSKSSRRSKSRSSGRKSEDVRSKSEAHEGEAPRISKRKKRKRKLKPSVLELPTISPSDLESRPPSAPPEEIPLEEVPLEEISPQDLPPRGDEDLSELDAAALDAALADSPPEGSEDDIDDELGESIDLDEDLDDEDLDEIDLGESIEDDLEEPGSGERPGKAEEDPFADMDLEELGAVPRAPLPRAPGSRPKPISRQATGALGEGEVASTRSDPFSPAPATDEAPVGLVSHEEPPAGPTFGSDIMLGSDVGVVGAQRPAELGPISFDDDFLSDLEVQRPASGSRSASQPEEGISARMVSARFSVQDCTIRWGRGGFPDDSSPPHTLIDFDGDQALFLLDHDDEAAATLAIRDELWVRIEVPAFLEPILTRATILDLAGSAGNGGTTATLEFSGLEAPTRRKLERAAAARR